MNIQRTAYLLVIAELHEGGEQLPTIVFFIVLAFPLVLILRPASSASPTEASSATAPVVSTVVHARAPYNMSTVRCTIAALWHPRAETCTEKDAADKWCINSGYSSKCSSGAFGPIAALRPRTRAWHLSLCHPWANRGWCYASIHDRSMQFAGSSSRCRRPGSVQLAQRSHCRH